MPTPHRVVHDVAAGVSSGVTGVVKSIQGGLKSAGHTVAEGMDKPFMAVTGKHGPHNMVGRALDGAIDAAANFPTDGVIKSLQIAGESICHALDQPVEEIGIPPDMKGLSLPKMPKLPE